MLLILPPLFVSFFIGFQFFRRWQHRNVHNYLEQSLLNLWKVKSLVEFVEFSKVTLQKLCSSHDAPQCFIVEDDKSLTDFSSRIKVSCNLKRNDDGAVKYCYQLKSSCSESKWLVSNGYLSQRHEAYIVCISSSKPDDVGSLIFLVSGDSLYFDKMVIKSYVTHASACRTRLDASNVNIPLMDSFEVVSTDTSDPISSPDVITMQKRLNNHFLQQSSCDSCCFLFLNSNIKQIVCHVVDDQELDYNILYPADDGFFAKAFVRNQPWFIEQTEKTLDSSEQSQLHMVFNFDVKTVLLIPITTSALDQGVVCLAYKSKHSYKSNDVDVVNSSMTRSWRRLSTLLALHEERERRTQCEKMLKIAKNLFTRLGDVGQLLDEVIQEARTLTNAERCSVFLVDKVANELVAKIFDGILTADENMLEIRMPLDRGIAGHVATTGKTLNIIDAYSHPLFYRGIDNTTGFKTRNILCFPIKDGAGEIVGVAELCNKIKGHSFTSYDEELAERFAIFCGISLYHSLMYKAVEESGSRNRFANELVAYHMKVDEIDIEENIPKVQLSVDDIDQQFDDFIYRPRDLLDDMKIKACIFMYQDLGLISAYHIPMHVLVHFVLMVRKGYRNPPYHNWDHAFSVIHHSYLIAKKLQFKKILSDLEIISLLTASICHDLDHRGTNNAFQVNSHSILANLYSSEGSVLERHHFAQAVCILSTAGCNIFENMKRKDYIETMALMKHIILATDVATHLAQMSELEKIEQDGLDLDREEHKLHLLALCMTASDLSDQTKDWHTTVHTSKLIYREFFYQGDMEKRMGNSPEVINDRERACVPQLQINFMLHIALPAYRILASIFPDYAIVHERVLLNIDRWKRVEAEFRAQRVQNRSSLEVLTDDFAKDLFKGLKQL